MMLFRTLKTNLEAMLAQAAIGRYQVVGYQTQGTGANEVLGNDRRVMVFYDSGGFDDGKAAIVGSKVQHRAVYRIELMASAVTRGDVAAITDPTKTPAEKAAAIAAFQNATKIADDSLDELMEIVYQILMDSRNSDIGTTGPPFLVSSRWVSGMQKDNPLEDGEFVVLTGSIDFSCMAVETVSGDTGTPAGAKPFEQTVDLDGDDVEKTGVNV